MEKRKKALEYRERLDRSLAKSDLSERESVRALVKEQILRSSSSTDDAHNIQGGLDNVVEKLTSEAWDFLELQRSVSGNKIDGPRSPNASQKEWKLKRDDDQLRVMYREGPDGTPFHTLLAEGYVDGPIDVCLCVSWESNLYPKWWPHLTLPPFKITQSERLKQIRIGEDISLVRMKVPWPLSMREVVLHAFLLEYFQDGLIIVILNSVDTDNIDVKHDGFTSDGIPDKNDAVRMDVIGGFALQKVSAEKSYFRTIATLDMKVDFVPPALINFMARQLVGEGFKLYEKTVHSIAKGNHYFDKVLENGLLYIRIREGIQACSAQNTNLKNACLSNSNGSANGVGDMHHLQIQTISTVDHVNEVKDEAGQTESLEKSQLTNNYDQKQEEFFFTEIEEEKEIMDRLPSSSTDNSEMDAISPEVAQALSVLDTAISFVQEHAHVSSLPKQVNTILADLLTPSVTICNTEKAIKNGEGSHCNGYHDGTSNAAAAVKTEQQDKEANDVTHNHELRYSTSDHETTSSPNIEGSLQSIISLKHPMSTETGSKTDMLDSSYISEVSDGDYMKINGINKNHYSPLRKTLKVVEKKWQKLCCYKPLYSS